MANPTIAAGYRHLFYGVNLNGQLVGNTATGATAGAQAGQGMLRLRGARTLPVQAGEDDVVEIEGDDEKLGTFEFEGSLPAGVFEMAERDLNFEALAFGTNVLALGDLNIGAEQPSNTSKPDLVLIASRRAKKSGLARWETKLIPICTVTPLGSEYATREAAAFQYSINLQKALHFPWGITYAEGNIGSESMPMNVIISENPIHIQAFQGDGAGVDYDTLFTPVSDAKSFVFVDRIQQALTADWTRVDKTFTLNVAPIGASRGIILYEFDEGDLS